MDLVSLTLGHRGSPFSKDCVARAFAALTVTVMGKSRCAATSLTGVTTDGTSVKVRYATHRIWLPDANGDPVYIKHARDVAPYLVNAPRVQLFAVPKETEDRSAGFAVWFPDLDPALYKGLTFSDRVLVTEANPARRQVLNEVRAELHRRFDSESINLQQLDAMRPTAAAAAIRGRRVNIDTIAALPVHEAASDVRQAIARRPDITPDLVRRIWETDITDSDRLAILTTAAELPLDLVIELTMLEKPPRWAKAIASRSDLTVDLATRILTKGHASSLLQLYRHPSYAQFMQVDSFRSAWSELLDASFTGHGNPFEAVKLPRLTPTQIEALVEAVLTHSDIAGEYRDAVAHRKDLTSDQRKRLLTMTRTHIAFTERPDLTETEMRTIAESESTTAVGKLVRNHQLPEDLLAQVCEKWWGVDFSISEELTTHTLELPDKLRTEAFHLYPEAFSGRQDLTAEEISAAANHSSEGVRWAVCSNQRLAPADVTTLLFGPNTAVATIAMSTQTLTPSDVKKLITSTDYSLTSCPLSPKASKKLAQLAPDQAAEHQYAPLSVLAVKHCLVRWRLATTHPEDRHLPMMMLAEQLAACPQELSADQILEALNIAPGWGGSVADLASLIDQLDD